MAVDKKAKATGLIGFWAFIIGLIIAVVMGIMATFSPALSDVTIIVLIILRIIIGFLNVTGKKVPTILPCDHRPGRSWQRIYPTSRHRQDNTLLTIHCRPCITGSHNRSCQSSLGHRQTRRLITAKFNKSRSGNEKGEGPWSFAPFIFSAQGLIGRP